MALLIRQLWQIYIIIIIIIIVAKTMDVLLLLTNIYVKKDGCEMLRNILSLCKWTSTIVY